MPVEVMAFAGRNGLGHEPLLQIQDAGTRSALLEDGDSIRIQGVCGNTVAIELEVDPSKRSLLVIEIEGAEDVLLVAILEDQPSAEDGS